MQEDSLARYLVSGSKGKLKSRHKGGKYDFFLDLPLHIKAYVAGCF
jgi:hypothetical protein